MTDRKSSAAWLVWAGLLFAGMALVGLLAVPPVPSQALAPLPPLPIQMSKHVTPTDYLPGQYPIPVYTISITNTSGETVTIDRITDTLPTGFSFVGMAPGSGWGADPDDHIEPTIVWNGPISVGGNSTLKVAYSVSVSPDVPHSLTPYRNSATASSGGQTTGPVYADLIIGGPTFAIAKSAAPTRVLNGDLVTYTVTLANSGEAAGAVDIVTDTLDPSLSFDSMATGSGVTAEPSINGQELVWHPGLSVPAGGQLAVKYRVSTTSGSEWTRPCNSAEAWAGGMHVGPASACVNAGPEHARVYLPVAMKLFDWAHFSITKSAYPTTLTASMGQLVTYTVTLANAGGYLGVLSNVADTLPSGFTFLRMMPGSNVTANPSGTTGTITWSGPFNVASGAQLRLIYQVQPGETAGQYVNRATARPLVGTSPGIASASVTVKPGILLEEHFNGSIDAWTKFKNYWRLSESQWFWDDNDGINNSGAADHRCCDNPDKEAEDALLMYLGPGAEEWANYRVEAKFNFRAGAGPVGLWVRGKYDDVGDANPAGSVTGYYIITGGRATSATHFVKLAQLQTLTDCWGPACDNTQNLYDFNNPHEHQMATLNGPLTRGTWHTLVVEVRGARIQAWLDGEPAIDFTDPKEPFLTGTVGLKTYKAEYISYDDVIVTPLP